MDKETLLKAIQKLLDDANTDKKDDDYISPKNFKYMYHSQNILPAQPMVIDYLEAKSNIYNGYSEMMKRRMELFPHLSYNFITKNNDVEIKIFLNKFPFFLNKVNIVQITHNMSKLMLKIRQYPYTIVTNEKNKIVYEGLINMQNYSNQLQCLDILCEKISKYYVQQKIQKEREKYLSNSQLSELLGGIHKETPKNSPKSDFILPIHVSSVNLPQLHKNTRSKSVDTRRTYIDLNQSKELIQITATQHGLTAPNFIRNAYIRGQFEIQK